MHKKISSKDLKYLLSKIPKDKREDFSRDYLSLINKYIPGGIDGFLH